MTNVQLWSLLRQKQIIDNISGQVGGVAASAGDYEREERRGLRLNRAFRLALRPCLPTGAGDALSHPRRGSPPFEAHKGSLRR